MKTIKSSRGAVMVELALVLPVLLLLAFGVADYAQAIQAKNILINMSREGANLASRTSSDPQEIMTALATTADPLRMSASGSMFITKVVGQDGSARVDEQYRWRGGASENSRVWGGCPRWSNDACKVPEVAPQAVLNVALADGEVVYAVEVFYDYRPIIGYVMQTSSMLYSITVF